MKAAEKRINKSLLRYWESLYRKYERIPHKSMINPNDIQDLWNSCFMLKTTSNEYDFMGDDVQAIKDGNSIIIKDIYNNLLCPKNSNIPYIVKEVLASKSPVSNDSSFENQYGVTIKYRRCFLPLLSDNDEISYILGCLRWRSYQ
ncbi:MAG: PAS domain-containing protein [Rickettsiales bacterium]|nr:PAS domain-containing protein [Pseudomonadota bacterium]MDA0966933.1 PAS domain-containing protein [Pseudomonadota bacterium]MDG4543852.1 PAS domain-containing protein [Rickettsiales bacterium]MDG4545998.1 PAS domain-containing protein [Rickettsiales bacterium]MDG4548244.1 PAS domain-containing protein [Rickettsiales bacterium]